MTLTLLTLGEKPRFKKVNDDNDMLYSNRNGFYEICIMKLAYVKLKYGDDFMQKDFVPLHGI